MLLQKWHRNVLFLPEDVRRDMQLIEKEKVKGRERKMI